MVASRFAHQSTGQGPRVRREIVSGFTRERYNDAEYVTAESLTHVVDDTPIPPADGFDAAFRCRIDSGTKYRETYEVGGPVNKSTGVTFGRHTKQFELYQATYPKRLVTPEEEEAIEYMCESLCSSDAVVCLMQQGYRDLCIRGSMYGTPCQAMPWWIRDHTMTIVELFTFGADNFNVFEFACHHMVKFAFTRMLLREVKEIQAQVFAVCVARRHPWETTVIHVDPDLLFSAEQTIVGGLTKYRKLTQKARKVQS